ncbi:MAG: hypothetical protein RLN69_01105 [Woeseiaceae bacterium]
MTEWLELMLDEVRRKNEERAEAAAESERRDAVNPGEQAKTDRDKNNRTTTG